MRGLLPTLGLYLLACNSVTSVINARSFSCHRKWFAISDERVPVSSHIA